MAQQPQGRPRNMLPLAIIYLITTFIFFQFIWKPQATPDQAKPLLEQARTLEAEGRADNPGVSQADRIKKLDQAQQKYEQFYQANKNTPEGWEARFKSINVFDYLATKLQTGDNHWFDQAEQRLKDMEKSLHGKTGTVTLEISGETVQRTGDLGRVATERLDMIRAARDVRNRSHWDYQAMNAVVQLFGGRSNPALSYFLALLLIVMVLKTVAWPFQKQQYKYMKDMARVQPLVKEMQEKMKGRPQEEVSRRMMEIYKENNVSLAGGCLPILVQMVTLYPVYFMVRAYEYQFTNAKFLWIGSPASLKSPWLADNLAQFDVPLFVIYLVSMAGYSLLQPRPTDPQQAQTQKIMMIMMPVMFGVMMWMYQWSSAFVLYWLILNAISSFQSWLLLKQYGLNTPGAGASGSSSGGGGTPVPVSAPAGPVKPMEGVRGKKDPNKRRPATTVPARMRPRGGR